MNTTLIRRSLNNINNNRKILITVSQRQQFKLTTTRFNKNNNTTIVRSYQSDKSWENPEQVGFFDTLAGVYEDPNYTVDIRPFEWREGQYVHYFSEFGIMFLCIPCIVIICASISMLTWYTLYDQQSSVLRDNPHPFFSIRHGQDLQNIRNPILMWTYPLGAHQDRKVHFYYEIEDAIERKKNLDGQTV